MRLVLPRSVKGYGYERLSGGVDLNDFDADRLLPAFFYLVVSRGRDRARAPNDPKDIDRYLDTLAQHRRLRGFDDLEGHRVLDRWIRASLLSLGRVGRAKRGEQINYIYPLTLLTYKSGLAQSASTLRNVHKFLYTSLIDLAGSLGFDPPHQHLHALFHKAFGHGVKIGPPPMLEGCYDDEADVDINTLLCMYYLDGFEAPQAARRASEVTYDPALPVFARNMAEDILRYILAYHEDVPPLALTRSFLALLGFELFCYTVKLAYATNSLLTNGALPSAMTLTGVRSEPEIYVDFTRERGSQSDEVAAACVTRDVEELRLFFASAMRLKAVDRLIQATPDLTRRVAELSTPEYLASLVTLAFEDHVQIAAGLELTSIESETKEANATDAASVDIEGFFREIRDRYSRDQVEALTQVIVQAQQKKAVENYVRWFYSSGGLRKPFGILAGNIRGKRAWRYVMSDDLLMTLTQLALLEDPSRTLTPQIRPRIRLSEFLDFLETRFGLLVSRVPAAFDGIEARTAARDNTEALKRRLRQMGFYEALSDDFNAQYISLPSQLEAVS
jgi:hypothetical protein